MKHYLLSGAAVLALGAGGVQAAGLDRSGQSVGAVFAGDNTITTTAGLVMPSVTGSDIPGAGTGNGSYDVGETYAQPGVSFTNSVNDRFSYSVIFDQPYGVDVSYGGSPLTTNLGGTGADLNSAAINFVGRVKLGDRFSVFGGVAAQRIGAEVQLNGTSYAGAISTAAATRQFNANLPSQAPALSAARLGAALAGDPAAANAIDNAYGQGTTQALGAGVNALITGTGSPLPAGFFQGGGYSFSMENTTRPNVFVGAAYEIPDIALRVAGTYRFETEHNADTTETLYGQTTRSSVTYVSPQSFMLEAQTGIAEGTLLTAAYRWTEFSAVDIVPTRLNSDLVTIDDGERYTLGLARRFSDTFAGSIGISYEPEIYEGPISPLAPTDGLLGVSVGGQYTDGNMKIAGGINYSRLGDAVVGAGSRAAAAFTDNHVVGVGFRAEISF